MVLVRRINFKMLGAKGFKRFSLLLPAVTDKVKFLNKKFLNKNFK